MMPMDKVPRELFTPKRVHFYGDDLDSCESLLKDKPSERSKVRKPKTEVHISKLYAVNTSSTYQSYSTG